MKHIVTNLLITALVIGIVRSEQAAAVGAHYAPDQVAQETRSARPALQIVEPPKYLAPKPNVSAPRQYYPPHVQKFYQKQKPVYHKQQKQTNAPPKYTKVIPLNGHQRPPTQSGPQHYPQKQTQPVHTQQPRPQLVFSASTGRPLYASVQMVKSPKFSLPIQTINGIRASDVKTPKPFLSTTTTTTSTTTTERPKRVKRIWPKHILDKINGKLSKNATLNGTLSQNATLNGTLSRNATLNGTLNTTANSTDLVPAASNRNNKYANRTGGGTSTTTSTTTTQTTPRVYRRVTRKPKVTSTTEKPDFNITKNDWIPMVPSHFPQSRRAAPAAGHPRRRSDLEPDNQTPADKRRQIYLQTYGIIPLKQVGVTPKRKLPKYRNRKRQLNSNLSGFSGRVVRPAKIVPLVTDLATGASRPRTLTKIKHHHHHHHHKYVRTVEKKVKVPVKVEVPKPYPVEKKVPYPVEKIVHKVVEKKVPYQVTVEKKVPFKVEVKVPQPYPVKVIEKEYVREPYPVVQQVQVPVVKHVEVKVPHPVPFPVPVQVEKKVPYPVHVKVPVDRPVPYPVEVEKRVPVPYPVKVYVPQPYAVEKRVPYPVEVKVKEPYEVIKHVQVPVKVYVPQPYPVRVPHEVRVPVEKRVPYPVEVERKVPVPVKVFVPQPYPVEKKVPVYITRHVAVPVRDSHANGDGGALSIHNSVQVVTASAQEEHVVSAGVTVEDNNYTSPAPAQHTVTVHGNGHFTGFSDRSDATTPAAPKS